MQPQETGFDWWHAVSGMAGAIIGAASTLLTWIIRAARMEPAIRADIKDSIAAAEARVEEKIDQAERRTDEKIEAETGHWRETLLGLREMINVVEKEFVRKEDFNQFRRENREDNQQLRDDIRKDFADLKSNIAEMLKVRWP